MSTRKRTSEKYNNLFAPDGYKQTMDIRDVEQHSYIYFLNTSNSNVPTRVFVSELETEQGLIHGNLATKDGQGTQITLDIGFDIIYILDKNSDD